MERKASARFLWAPLILFSTLRFVVDYRTLMFPATKLLFLFPKPLPFRILHTINNSETSFVIAESSSWEEILRDWQWIEGNLMPTLINFESEEDVTSFVRCKIESLVQVVADHSASAALNSTNANNSQQSKESMDSTFEKFIKLFNMPEEEKLVNCKSICIWKLMSML